MTTTLAIFSPNQNAYSETFIQAHKSLPFFVKYYYDGWVPSMLENCEDMLKISLSERIKRRILTGFSFSKKKLLFSLRKEKIDCVLAEYGPTACYNLPVIKYAGLPLIVHFHGSDASEKELIEQYREQYFDVFQYASKVIVVSSKMKQALLGLGCPEEKLVTNCYGPEQSFFEICPSFNEPSFISVGRFVEKKSPQLTILAFQKVLKKYPLAKLTMVGDGKLLNSCKNMVEELKLQINIEFKGVCNAGQVRELFNKSIAFVQHSIVAENGDSEGTPVAVLEAQAAGLPVIATYHGGIPDVVIHNETGLLSVEKDVDAMANNMLRVLVEEGLSQRLGEAGRKRIKQHFSLEKHLATLAHIIEGAVNK